MVKSCWRQAGGFTSLLMHCGSNKWRHSESSQAGISVSVVTFRVRGLQNWAERQSGRKWKAISIAPQTLSWALCYKESFWKSLKCVICSSNVVANQPVTWYGITWWVPTNNIHTQEPATQTGEVEGVRGTGVRICYSSECDETDAFLESWCVATAGWEENDRRRYSNVCKTVDSTCS